jgi:CelD/BcsL family acetyltransferase involved in cellulose biosynthesis
LAPEFAVSVGRARRGVRVAVIFESAEIVGFLPFSLVGRRFARPAGPGISDSQGMVHHVDHPLDLVEVITRTGLVGWSFDHLLSFQAPAGQFVSAGRSWVVGLTDGAASVEGDAKVAPHHNLRDCARKLRRLERDSRAVEFRFATAPDPTLARLFELKRAQCRREGWRDVLAVPWVEAVVRDLAGSCTEALTGVVSALFADDEILSVEFGIRSADVYASWIQAYDMRYSRHSPGSLLWYQLFPRLAEGGVRCIDLGKGLTEAKRRFSTGSVDIAEGFAARRGAVGGCAATITKLRGMAHDRAAGVESSARRAVRTVRRWQYRTGRDEVPKGGACRLTGVPR